LFSEFYGLVLREGVPVSGATVTRSYTWADKTVRDSIVSDDKGEFYFPLIRTRSLWTWLPGEVVIRQTIMVEHEKIFYEAWSLFKHNLDVNGEVGRPVKMRCDLANPPSRVETGPYDQGYFGICTLE